MLNKFMFRFSKWFASPGGVLQTFIVVTAWVIVERIWPDIDPQGFWLLYVLTVYSAITQPVLAYAASESAEEARQSQEVLQKLLEANMHQTEAILQVLEHMAKEVKP